MKKKVISILMAITLLSSCAVTAFATEETISDEKIVILHTNDTHCDIENGFGFAGVAAYKADVEATLGSENVTLVDAGDAIQGGAIGALTTGQAIIDLLNEVGYDYMTLGNHEFDYQVPRMKELMADFNGKVVSSNFVELATGKSVYNAYDIVDYGFAQVAYVGISTPETFTKSTPAYFQDESGNFIYSFSQGNNGQDLYNNVQSSVDAAIADGADYVVAVSHLGVDNVSAPWRSTDVIANTTGIDIVLDGHSHSTVEGKEVENEDGEIVLLNQTGDKFNNLGQITIDATNDTIKAELISSDEYTEKDPTVQAKVNEINNEFETLLNTVVANTCVSLVVNNPETGKRMIRSQETNLGDLCADAYRNLLDTDVAIVNGGGIRADIEQGEITNADIIAVHPWGNQATSVRVSGQVLLNALEMGAKGTPEESGGFLQVSGMTYSIDTTIPTSVVTNDEGSFVEVAGEYRVCNVMVGGQPLDLNKMYTVAAHDYMLLSFGDGMTMFKDAQVIKDRFMVDNEVLIHYITNGLGGVVGEEYSNINGQGRITILTEQDKDDDTTSTTQKEDDTTSTTEKQDDTTSTTQKQDDTTSTTEKQDDTTSTTEKQDDTTSPHTGDTTHTIFILSIALFACGIFIFGLSKAKK